MHGRLESSCCNALITLMYYSNLQYIHFIIDSPFYFTACLCSVLLMTQDVESAYKHLNITAGYHIFSDGQYKLL